MLVQSEYPGSWTTLVTSGVTPRVNPLVSGIRRRAWLGFGLGPVSFLQSGAPPGPLNPSGWHQVSRWGCGPLNLIAAVGDSRVWGSQPGSPGLGAPLRSQCESIRGLASPLPPCLPASVLQSLLSHHWFLSGCVLSGCVGLLAGMCYYKIQK